MGNKGGSQIWPGKAVGAGEAMNSAGRKRDRARGAGSACSGQPRHATSRGGHRATPATSMPYRVLSTPTPSQRKWDRNSPTRGASVRKYQTPEGVKASPLYRGGRHPPYPPAQPQPPLKRIHAATRPGRDRSAPREDTPLKEGAALNSQPYSPFSAGHPQPSPGCSGVGCSQAD